MGQDALLTTLLDLDHALGGKIKLLIGGGYGLYLKQLYLYQHPELTTLFPMKLMAFRDRMNDSNKDLGRHHALDIYRIIGMITRSEYLNVKQVYAAQTNHPAVAEARQIIKVCFLPLDGLGRIRILEHPLASRSLDLEPFVAELESLLFS